MASTVFRGIKIPNDATKGLVMAITVVKDVPEDENDTLVLR